MDPQNTNANMNMNRPPRADEGSVGPVVATIIILAVIVLGGLYFWNQRKADMNAVPTDTMSTSIDTTSGIDTQSSSDTTSSINTDLNSTDTTGVDSQLNGS
jgi:hypothetical protein